MILTNKVREYNSSDGLSLDSFIFLERFLEIDMDISWERLDFTELRTI